MEVRVTYKLQKVTYSSIIIATSSLLPYLTIHMQSVGLTIEEIGMIYLALPFTTFLAPPLTGKLLMCTDKILFSSGYKFQDYWLTNSENTNQ